MQSNFYSNKREIGGSLRCSQERFCGGGGVTKGHNKPWAMMDEPIVLSMTTVSGCTRHGQTYQSIQFIARSLNLKSSHAKNPSKVLHCFPSKTPRDLVVWHNLGPTYLCITHHFHTSNSLPKHTQPFPAPGHLNVSPCPERSFSSIDLSAFSKSQVRNHRAISWCPGLEAGSSQVASPAIALCIYPFCRDYRTDFCSHWFNGVLSISLWEWKLPEGKNIFLFLPLDLAQCLV